VLSAIVLLPGRAGGSWCLDTTGDTPRPGAGTLPGSPAADLLHTIVDSKAALSGPALFWRSVLCNALVCLAVWLSYSARSLTDKFFAVLLPISAFVAAGFEHSIANMYFLPLGLFVKSGADEAFWHTTGASAGDYPNLTWSAAAFDNIAPVTLGNIFGGAVMVGLVYWLVYRRPAHTSA